LVVDLEVDRQKFDLWKKSEMMEQKEYSDQE
jgi:hypothetical protein